MSSAEQGPEDANTETFESSHLNTDLLQIVVMLQPDTRFIVSLERSATVAQLRRLLRGNQLRETARSKQILLVAAGRVMQDSQVLSFFSNPDIQPNSLVVHCVLTDSAERVSESTAGGPPRRTPLPSPRRQPPAADATTPPDSVTVTMPPEQAARGFDRLRILGLDDAEVTLFRQLYLPTALEEVGASVPLRAGELEAARVLRIEEHWMARQDPRSEFGINLRSAMASRGVAGGEVNPWQVGVERPPNNGEDRDAEGNGDGAAAAAAAARQAEDDTGDEDGAGQAPAGSLASFFMGFAAGYFLGIVAAICLCNGQLSRRFKNGIWFGIIARALIMAFFGPVKAPASSAPPGLADELQPRNPVPPSHLRVPLSVWPPVEGPS